MPGVKTPPGLQLYALREDMVPDRGAVRGGISAWARTSGAAFRPIPPGCVRF
jgi:hypothetical protein